MADTWITDMTHYLEDGRLPADLPIEAFRMADYLGGLVMVATAWPAGQTWFAAQPCRRRPGRRPCPGPVGLVRTQVSARVEWTCSGCGDRGVTSGWRGTPWDLSKVWAGKQTTEIVSHELSTST